MGLVKRGVTAHEISYAYATSTNASVLGFEKTGCFVFETESTFIGVATLAEAKQLATDAKTDPTRWSLDHPHNIDLMLHFSLAQPTQRTTPQPTQCTPGARP